MKNIAIILAAGKGKRMKADKNKQFLQIKGKPILYHTLNAFSFCNEIDEIVLVAAKEEIDYCKKEIVKKYNFNKVKYIVEGGKERQDSVLNGLLAIENSDCDIVLIHDGARPFVNNNIIENCISYSKKYGATACGVNVKDTIKIKDKNNFSIDTPNRESLFAVQTPQGFKYNLILDCHKKIKELKLIVTDDTMVVEKFNNKVFLYEGSYNNIKITTPEDLILGENLIKG